MSVYLTRQGWTSKFDMCGRTWFVGTGITTRAEAERWEAAVRLDTGRLIKQFYERTEGALPLPWGANTALPIQARSRNACCRECGIEMRDGARRDRLYCKPACRQRAYRKRKSDAGSGAAPGGRDGGQGVTSA
jgi:hypothetical protein